MPEMTFNRDSNTVTDIPFGVCSGFAKGVGQPDCLRSWRQLCCERDEAGQAVFRRRSRQEQAL